MTRPITIALLAVLAGCSRSKNDDHRSSPIPAATPDPRIAEEAAAYKKSVAGHESWRPSSSACPIKMSALPPPKRAENLGQVALDQGPRQGRLNTNIVKSFDEGKPISRKGTETVDVLYVETERVDPELDPGSQTFKAGHSKGVAYVWDATQSRFACMANVTAESSSSVTSLGKADRGAMLWITLDLMFAIEREIVANAHAIETP